MFLIVKTYAVVDPGAVMVHSGNTGTASGTVVGMGWFYGLASVTEGCEHFFNVFYFTTGQFIIVTNAFGRNFGVFGQFFIKIF